MIDWFGASLPELNPVYERVKPPRNETLQFTVSGYEIGARTVHTKPYYKQREKVAIGLTVDRVDKPDKIHHWALYGPEITAILEPYLANPATAYNRFSLQMVGRKPFQHWIVEISPRGVSHE